MTAQPERRNSWLEPCSDPAWCIRKSRASSARDSAVEARFTVSNGLLGMRGAREEARAGLHPRILVAGLFDPLDMDPPIPALVPAPDWLGLRVKADGILPARDSSWGNGQVRMLDLRRGALWRDWHTRDDAGRAIHLRTCRFASAVCRHLAVHITEITVDQATVVTVEEPDLQLDSELVPVFTDGPVAIWETNDRKRRLAVARAAMLDTGDEDQPRRVELTASRPLTLTLAAGRPAILTRMVAMVPAMGGDDPSAGARTVIEDACRQGPRALFAEHVDEWARRWDASDVQVEGDRKARRALRFAAYHLISAANPENEQVSVGARGLTGEAYWGHVFWDTDIFLIPFYALTWPEAARAMLMYRYHGLGAAREKAARFGYQGALYAWEAAEGGEEATPDFVNGPEGKRIEIKTGTEEHHISADVAYAVWQYWQATGDDAFFRDAGAEIILETARFWASRATLGPDGRYHIARVVGPDEYHEDVDDNAFTNGLARWNLLRGRDAAHLLKELWPEQWAVLRNQLGITAHDLKLWRMVAMGLAMNTDAATGVIEQFAGYFNLEPIDLAVYEPRTQPLDVLLGREAMQRSQAIKQADVLMLQVLLWDRFTARQRKANFAYYEPRCGHGSSLSPAMHALLSARLGDVDLAKRYFDQAAAIDLDDTMGNAAGGIHLATQGGLWQAAVFGFGGLQLCEDGLRIDPHLPAGWRSLAFRVQWRGRRVHIAIQQEPRAVTATLEHGPPLRIHVGNKETTLDTGQCWTTETRQRARRPRSPRRKETAND
jgi:trehalose/maltose hydrolase-like predicted phosphorylase